MRMRRTRSCHWGSWWIGGPGLQGDRNELSDVLDADSLLVEVGDDRGLSDLGIREGDEVLR